MVKLYWMLAMCAAILLVGCGSSAEMGGNPADDGAPVATEPLPDDTSVPPMLMYFMTDYDDRDLYVFDTETGEVTQLTDDDLNQAGFALSPDRSQIAYSLIEQDDPTLPATGGLFVMNLDGSERRQIGEGVVFSMAWTPDATTLIYGIAGTTWNDSSIVVHNLVTGAVTTLTDSAPSSAVALSPDGTRLAYLTLRDKYFLHLIIAKPDGSDPLAIELNDLGLTQAYNFQWSPDSSKLVFSAWDGECFMAELSNASGSGCSEENIYIVNVDRAEAVALVELPERDTNPNWTPDGRVFFVSDTTESGMQVSNTGIIDPATSEIVWMNDFPPYWLIRSITYAGECKGQAEVSRLHYVAVGMGGDRVLEDDRQDDFALLELQIRPSASGTGMPEYNGITLDLSLPAEWADQITRGTRVITCKP